MPTTIKDAISKWEEKSGEKASEATRVDLYGQSPPIEKMDAALGILTNCERLGLSTNNIDKIAGLNALKKLKILSLGRNGIKALTGLENLGETLEELWLSYNLIDRLKGIQSLKKLKVLYMSHNLVKDMNEVLRVGECPKITELIMVGNPVYEKHMEAGDWSTIVPNKIKSLKKLDGLPIIREDDDDE